MEIFVFIKGIQVVVSINRAICAVITGDQGNYGKRVPDRLSHEAGRDPELGGLTEHLDRPEEKRQSNRLDARKSSFAQPFCATQ